MKSRKPGDPFAVTVQQIPDYYPSSRASIVNWIKSGDLPSFFDGRRRLILFSDLRAFTHRRARAGRGEISPQVSAGKAAAGRKGRAAQLAELAERKAGR